MPILTGEGKIYTRNTFIVNATYTLIVTDAAVSILRNLTGWIRFESDWPLNRRRRRYVLHTEYGKEVPICLLSTDFLNGLYIHTIGPSAGTDWLDILALDQRSTHTHPGSAPHP